MKLALTIVFIIVSIALTIVVMMQEGKANGLGSLAGSSSSDTYWSKNKGRSKEGTMVKVTIALGILFFIIAGLLCSKLFA